MSEDISRVSRELQRIGKQALGEIDKVAPGTDPAFILIVFIEDQCQYIGNADRTHVIAAMRDLIEKWESGMPDIPAHKKN